MPRSRVRRRVRRQAAALVYAGAITFAASLTTALVTGLRTLATPSVQDLLAHATRQASTNWPVACLTVYLAGPPIAACTRRLLPERQHQPPDA